MAFFKNEEFMRYSGIEEGTFLERLNRFEARVILGGRAEIVHVKNTGRCRELLLEGARIFLSRSDNPNRKTRYDLVTVQRQDGRLVNIDSMAPNLVVREWLERQDFDRIIPEYRYLQSRIDFYMERRMPGTADRDGRREDGETTAYLMEVKGCTLIKDGIGYFPDAPTERGTRHLRDLIHARQQGMVAIAAFVIQTDGVDEVRPNRETDASFAETLDSAKEAGVHIIMLPCHVEPDLLVIDTDWMIPMWEKERNVRYGI